MKRAALDRKTHIAEQKKLYKQHHTIRDILVAALPHKEYLKMSDKSTTKAMFTSLCSLYDGNICEWTNICEFGQGLLGKG